MYQRRCHKQDEGGVLQILEDHRPEGLHLDGLESVLSEGLLPPVQCFSIPAGADPPTEAAVQFACQPLGPSKLAQMLLALGLRAPNLA